MEQMHDKHISSSVQVTNSFSKQQYIEIIVGSGVFQTKAVK